MPQVRIVQLGELTAEMRAEWLHLLPLNPAMSGPCFHPRLFSAVGKFQSDAFAAIWHENGRLTAVLPFLKGPFSTAKPVPMCDYQFLLRLPGMECGLNGILRGASLNAWDIDNGVGFQEDPSVSWVHKHSPRVNLKNGLESYLETLDQKNVHFHNLANKKRRLERDAGEIRFETVCDDKMILDLILRWKAEKFNRSENLPSWVANTLNLLREPQDGFSTALSVLFAGGKPIAAHFGPRYEGVLHYWFGAFDPAYSKYTPGLLLVHNLVTHLEKLGCEVMDFGPGGELYKENFMNDALSCVSGSAVSSKALSFFRKTKAGLTTGLKTTPGLNAAVRFARRALKP